MECILSSVYIQDSDSIKGSSAVGISGREPELAAGTEDLDKSLTPLSQSQSPHQLDCKLEVVVQIITFWGVSSVWINYQMKDQFIAWHWTYCFTFWWLSSPLLNLVCSFIPVSENWFEIYRWGRLCKCNCLALMSICSKNWLTKMCTCVHTHMHI